MPETMQNLHGVSKWHWVSIMSDLEEQGGLPGVIINPTLMSDSGCGGQTANGTVFFVTWIKDTFLLISVTEEEQALIDAFAKVVGYQPFCRYVGVTCGLLTFEWDKEDPEGRFVELQKDEVIAKDLQRL